MSGKNQHLSISSNIVSLLHADTWGYWQKQNKSTEKSGGMVGSMREEGSRRCKENSSHAMQMRS